MKKKILNCCCTFSSPLESTSCHLNFGFKMLWNNMLHALKCETDRVEKSNSYEYRFQLSIPELHLLANEFQFVLSVAGDVVEFENAAVVVYCQAIFDLSTEVWFMFCPIQSIIHAFAGIPPKPAVYSLATFRHSADGEGFTSKKTRLLLIKSEEMIVLVFGVKWQNFHSETVAYRTCLNPICFEISWNVKCFAVGFVTIWKWFYKKKVLK